MVTSRSRSHGRSTRRGTAFMLPTPRAGAHVAKIFKGATPAASQSSSLRSSNWSSSCTPPRPRG